MGTMKIISARNVEPSFPNKKFSSSIPYKKNLKPSPEFLGLEGSWTEGWDVGWRHPEAITMMLCSYIRASIVDIDNDNNNILFLVISSDCLYC